MRKQREKVSIKAAALLLGAALLTGGCSGYQSSEELGKGAENVQAETVNGSGNGAEGVSGSENAQITVRLEKTEKLPVKMSVGQLPRSSKAKQPALQRRHRSLKRFLIRFM